MGCNSSCLLKGRSNSGCITDNPITTSNTGIGRATDSPITTSTPPPPPHIAQHENEGCSNSTTPPISNINKKIVIQQNEPESEEVEGKFQTNPIPHPLGLSIAYLDSQVFQQDLQDAGIDYFTAKIYDMDPDLTSSDFGLLRSKGQHITCPRDNRLGSAYVDSIDAEYVGPANVMLSYSWNYAIRDVVESLVAKCEKDNLDPKESYVWICCFCNNQHRIGQTNASFDEFRQTFYGILTRIKIVWSLMAPWNKPGYLERIWCIFEIYTANTTDGCHSEIIMPPRERKSMLQSITKKGGNGFKSLVTALGKTKIENTKASQQKDLDNILRLVKDYIGYATLDVNVNEVLRRWVEDEIMEEDKRKASMSEDPSKDLEYASFCNQAGLIFLQLVNLDGAVYFYKKSLSIKENVLPKHSPSLATSYNNIGLVLKTKGDLDGALDYLMKSLSVQEKVLDKDSPSLATSYNNIGFVLKTKGDFDHALSYYKKALSIKEKVLDKDHSPSLATSYNNVGTLLRNKGDLDESLDYFKKAVSIRKNVLDEDSPDLAISYNNIGSVLRNMGELDEALEYLMKSLSIFEKVLDKDSPSLATSYNNIGGVLQDKGDLDGALDYRKKALFITESQQSKS